MIFFFHLHSFKSPVKWVTGPEPEMCTRGLYASKTFKYRVQKHLEVHVMLSFINYTPSRFSLPFPPCSPNSALVRALLYWCFTAQSAPWNSCMEVVKMKNRFSRKTMGALCCAVVVTLMSRRGFGEMQVIVSVICTKRQTPTLSRVF